MTSLPQHPYSVNKFPTLQLSECDALYHSFHCSALVTSDLFEIGVLESASTEKFSTAIRAQIFVHIQKELYLKL